MKKNKDLVIEGNTITGTAEAITGALKSVADRVKDDSFWTDRDYIIMAAKIKDGICQYSFCQTRGFNRGEEHSVKGALIVEPDLEDAVAQLAVHLAMIDDAFKLAGVEVDDIRSLRGHELTLNYTVIGFEVKGDEDAETVVITGSKRVAGGRMDIKSYRIPIDSHSSYRWFAELADVVDHARQEVALYREGKGSQIEIELEEKPDKRQSKLPFGEGDEDDIDDEFETGRK